MKIVAWNEGLCGVGRGLTIHTRKHAIHFKWNCQPMFSERYGYGWTCGVWKFRVTVRGKIYVIDKLKSLSEAEK